jgi:hypothetical protein
MLMELSYLFLGVVDRTMLLVVGYLDGSIYYFFIILMYIVFVWI